MADHKSKSNLSKSKSRMKSTGREKKTPLVAKLAPNFAVSPDDPEDLNERGTKKPEPEAKENSSNRPFFSAPLANKTNLSSAPNTKQTGRTCSNCKETLPKDAYSKNQWAKRAYKRRCKGCVENKCVGMPKSSTQPPTTGCAPLPGQTTVPQMKLLGPDSIGYIPQPPSTPENFVPSPESSHSKNIADTPHEGNPPSDQTPETKKYSVALPSFVQPRQSEDKLSSMSPSRTLASSIQTETTFEREHNEIEFDTGDIGPSSSSSTAYETPNFHLAIREFAVRTLKRVEAATAGPHPPLSVDTTKASIKHPHPGYPPLSREIASPDLRASNTPSTDDDLLSPFSPQKCDSDKNGAEYSSGAFMSPQVADESIGATVEFDASSMKYDDDDSSVEEEEESSNLIAHFAEIAGAAAAKARRKYSTLPTIESSGENYDGAVSNEDDSTVDRLEQPASNGDRHDFLGIIGHIRNKNNGSIRFKVQWKNGEVTAETQQYLRKDDPITVKEYLHSSGLINTDLKQFDWARFD